jgi:hypothetical protein
MKIFELSYNKVHLQQRLYMAHHNCQFWCVTKHQIQSRKLITSFVAFCDKILAS